MPFLPVAEIKLWISPSMPVNKPKVPGRKIKAGTAKAGLLPMNPSNSVSIGS